MSKDDFFIGWSPDMPKGDRRAFLATGAALVSGAAIGAGVLASRQRPAGNGTWAMGDVREWTGVATAEPYAMLRTLDDDGRPRTLQLACLDKCGVAARINSYQGQHVTVKGSLIERGPHGMIAVIDGMDWIAPAGETLSTSLVFPEIEILGEVDLSGEILDTKCWFGAMRPSEGKVHKSCASLCIRGGLPPGFYVKAPQDQSALMIMTDSGLGHSDAILPYVADPVRVRGTLQRWGDLYLLDAPASAISRI
ncbi:MAG: hypothetical protein AAF216_05825 [Pseudomonadota bacterium]